MTIASSIFLASIPILVSFYAEKYRLQDLQQAFPNDPPDFGLPVPETFDFIIVGGGSSGLVVANRLSEKFTVLVLEAGGNPPPLTNIPVSWHIVQELPDINFLYRSTPQENAGLENGGVILTTAGKMLGGSGSHNGLIYQRGNPKDFDRWANETGDDSWSYKNVLPFFKKTEKYLGKMDLSKDHHGYDGPLATTEDEYSPGRDIWLEAGRELGYEVGDSNGPQKVGFYPGLTTKFNGRRQSSYTAYIKPIEGKRKNLKIYRYSYVSKVIIDPKTKAAQGVQYTRHGVPRAAFASKEVILSAGPYVSPLILIQSGIGPVDQLEAAKVEPISILPAGQNLMDHPFVILGPFNVDKPEYAWNMESDLTFQDFDDYVKEGKGPISGLWQGSTGAFIASTRRIAKGHPDWPDLQLFYAYSHSEKNTINAFLGMQDIQTRGSIKLNTSATSMADDNLPIIDFNYFDDPSDLQVAVEGIKHFLKIFEETNAFRRIGARLTAKPHENCKHVTFRSDDYWKCFVRQTAATTWHPVSTCRMGSGPEDPMAVVDTKLRVIGVKNLRVIDSSIMPHVTNANTFAPTLMVAEKGVADILKQYDGKSVKSEL